MHSLAPPAVDGREIALVIPTLNPSRHIDALIGAINHQRLKPKTILVVDSSSTDESVGRLASVGASIYVISREQFDHGGTRQLAVEMLMDCDFIAFITQDSIFANNVALENLLEPFKDSNIAATYGRQLPWPGSGPIEMHARLFNYPGQSRTKKLVDAVSMGIKVAFLSDSFSAYRVSALHGIGGFPRTVIFGEDMYVAAKLLMAGHAIHYCSDAHAWHSHSYSLCQEFARSFDIGVFHSREHWILDTFGVPEGEGMRFVRSEVAYLGRNAPWMIPEAIIRNAVKLLGYRAGKLERYMTPTLKRKLCMNKIYWQ